MALFQTSVLKQHSSLQDNVAVEKAYKKYQKYFLNPTIQENIKSSKEEQFQATFLTQLFVNILGYTINPSPKYNITTEFKNQKNARKADGAILKDGQAIGVIELKGTKTKDLESIRRQAFDYKANQKGCVYVITSNFEKLRFYVNDATEFEEFNLFELSQERFQLLYLCLHKDNILRNLPLTIKEASIVEEEKITKSFYSDYSVFKRELFRDLVKRNAKRLRNEANLIGNEQDFDEHTQAELQRLEKNVKLTLFKKSQRLIDRFLFIFFAEDRMLLPSNSTLQILNKWKDDWDFGDERPLYGLFKQYFNFLDVGRKGTEKRAEIYAYNGGLFKPDAILDSLDIDNDLLYKYTLKLANYDFESQVDVNILGHIFENSLNEIESVNAEIEGGEFDKQKSKRKKDGVFYTPKYITKYIVENTVGKLCEEKKAELGFHEEEYFKGRKNRNKATIEKLVAILDTYRNWLLQITICDPACGSGAFLNQALDFLIKEHTYIDELKAKVLGGGLQFPDIENTILENNIFGVDLNEESVEIAKLSLWLRTAQPRRKLNDLSSNIKCGNSLIDSKSVAGDKAFNWEIAFAKVFEKGGFDVIIGNPPYVRVQSLKEYYFDHTIYYEKNYKSTTGNYDIYALFIEKSYNLINQQGCVSFILPHKFLIADFGKGIREYLLEKRAITELVSFGSDLVFQDATTYTCIIDLAKNRSDTFLYKEINPNDLFEKIDFGKIRYDNLTSEQWILTDENIGIILDKLLSQPLSLKTEFTRFVQGIITGKDAVFCVEGTVSGGYLEIKPEDITGQTHYIEVGILKPHLRGQDIKPYTNLKNNEWLIFPYSIENDKATLIEPDFLSSKYPKAFEYLRQFESILRDREKGKFDNDYWYQYSRNQAISILEQPKLITPEVCFGGSFTLDLNNFYHNSKCHTLLLSEKSAYSYKSVLPILNSKLFWFYLSSSGNVLRGGYIGVKRKVLEPFGLPNSENIDSSKFENFSTTILSLTSKLELTISKFEDFYLSQYPLHKLTKKLKNWNELDFGDFIKEFNKAIKVTNKERLKQEQKPIAKLTKLDEIDWMDAFNNKKKEVQDLQSQITQTEAEIDQMVYQLYGLTEEEIMIVEDN
ncbi:MULTISPECIES: Eco57I restriction-modification methylase domain-containing protein [Flavobacteriaceae]|uniref:site-specific DNA-methyltransferase (adenine-specific) n=2 Tax=Flavobacteriaceae TaxID=49546 RepID=A0A2T0MAZ9_9FLAO|nr:N-6 DNA methylase [Allomuricauda pacifica]PRX54667.1 TaqI restriction endonuclease [Allomuricauda pacifica]